LNRTDDAPKTATAGGLSRVLLLAGGSLVLLWQLALLLHKEFNWDEYYFLSLVFQYRQGTLEQPLQTFHVHLFSWLADLPWSDSNRIVVGRSVMLLLHSITLLFIYGLTRRLVSAQAAVWSVVLYASLHFVLVHATSFRADPLITFLLVGALYLLAKGPLGFPVLLASSLAIVLAMLVSVKAVIYFPLIAALMAFQLKRSTERGRDAMYIAAAMAISLVAFAGMFYFHSMSLKAGDAEGVRILATIAEKQFGSTRYTGLRFLLESVLINACFYLLAIAGVAYACAALCGKVQMEPGKAALMLVFASPLLLSVFYRNSFPYFYVFMMAPVAVVAGFAAAMLEKFWRAFALLVAASVLVTVPVFQRSQDAQREVETAIHQMFPVSIPYLDRCGMIASYPRASFFMSSWGLENYLRTGKPLLAQAIASQQPAFLLVTHPVLEEALGLPLSAPTGGYALLREDAKALNENYIPHWGPVWVAGKHLPAAESGFPLTVLIGGQYTFEATSAGTLDGETIVPGTTVTLDRGPHAYAGPTATLRFGNHLATPMTLPPKPFFLGF
jgi:hypothetical protein